MSVCKNSLFSLLKHSAKFVLRSLTKKFRHQPRRQLQVLPPPAQPQAQPPPLLQQLLLRLRPG